MDEKQLQFLFNEYAKGRGFKDYNEFKLLMSNEDSRRVFFDESNKELGFKDFYDFENTLGIKKKSNPLSPSQSSGIPSFSQYKEQGYKQLEKGTSVFDITAPENNITKLEKSLQNKAKAFNRETYRFQDPNFARGFTEQERLALEAGKEQAKQDYDKYEAESNELLKSIVPEIKESILPFAGKYTKKGVVDFAAMMKDAENLSKNMGGDKYVKEVVLQQLKSQEEFNIIKPQYQKEFGKLYKKEFGKTPEESIAEFTAKKSNLENTYSQTITRLTKNAEKDAKLLGEEAENLVKVAQQNNATQEEIDAIIKNYVTRLKGINYNANNAAKRIYKEIENDLNQTAARLGLTEAESKRIKKLSDEAYKNVIKGKYEADVIIQDQFIKQFGYAPFAIKSAVSRAFTGVSQIGKGLVGLDLGGGFADFLRGFEKVGREWEVVDLELKGKNLFKPETYISRVFGQLGYQAPLITASIATSNPFLGGMVGFASEQLQNAGEVYDRVMQETGNPVDAQKKAEMYVVKNLPTLALSFFEAGLLLKMFKFKGNFLKNALAEQVVENSQELYQGYTQQDKPLSEFIKNDAADIIKETSLVTLLQSGLMTGVGKVGSLYKSGSYVPTVHLYGILKDKGLNAANAITELSFQNNIIDEQKLLSTKQRLAEINDQITELREKGLSDFQIGSFIKTLSKIDALKEEMEATTIPEARQKLQKDIENLQEELAINATTEAEESVSVVLPSGASMPVDGKPNEVVQSLKEEIKSGQLDVVTSDPSANKKIEELKPKQSVEQENAQEAADFSLFEIKKLFAQSNLSIENEDGRVVITDMNTGNEVDVFDIPEALQEQAVEFENLIGKTNVQDKISENKQIVTSDVGVMGVGQRDVESTAKALDLIEDVKLSNLVDDLSLPTRLYHWGKKEIKKFSPTSEMTMVTGEKKKANGIYFTADKNLASSYKQFKPDGELYEASVILKKPKIVKLNKDTIFVPDEKLKEYKEQGYDGLIYEGKTGFDEVVVFNPESIIRDTADLAEAYHKAKADGSNPELVEAIESLLSKEQTQPTETKTKEEVDEETIDNAIRKIKESGKPLSDFKVGDKVVWADEEKGMNRNFKMYTEGIIIKAGNEYEIKRFPENPISKKYQKAIFNKNVLVVPKLEGEAVYTGEESILIKKINQPTEAPTETKTKEEIDEKVSEIDGRRLIEFKKGDIVYTNWLRRDKRNYEEYEIVDDRKDLWKLKNLKTGAIQTFNAANNGGFIKKEDLKEEPPVSGDVVNVPISDIKTNTSEYQGRKNKFSERSAANVAKNFDKNKFDPIVVYRNPDGNIYVLSGHSRLEGMKRRGEKTIPARFFNGTPEEAKDFALKSNKLGTLQTDLENAAYYRETYKKGKSYSSLMAEAKETEQEGSASRIMDYAMLNPNGKAYQALESLESGESDSSTNIKIIAQKVGRIRSKNDHLTDAHENELFDYFLANGFPTDKEINDVNNVINRSINAVKFNPSEPLNLKKVVTKSSERIEWEKELKEFESQISELKKQVNPDKKTGWTGLKESVIAQLAKSKSPEEIEKAQQKFNNNEGGVYDIYRKKLEESKQKLSVLQDKLAKHLLREKSLIEGEKSQKSLFDTEEEAKPRKRGEEISFVSNGNNLVGERIEINGFEDVDFVLVQEGMSFRIYELSTGTLLNDISAFSQEEAIKEAEEYLNKKFKNQEKLLDLLYKNKQKQQYKIKTGNQSEKLQKYIEKREQEEKAELEKLPYVHNEQERKMISDYAEQAKSEGLGYVYDILTSIKNSRQGRYSGAKLTEERVLQMIETARQKKTTEEEVKNQKPLTNKEAISDSEEKLKEAINSNYEKDRYSQIPSEIRQKVYDAYKKEVAIRNKYGYYPQSIFTFDGAVLALGKYTVAQNSKDQERIKKEEENIENYIDNINELYEKEIKPKAKKEKRTIDRKIRDEKTKNELRNAINDLKNVFGKPGPLTSAGLDPEKLEKVSKIISILLKQGYHKFSDLVEFVYDELGDLVSEWFDELKGAYAYHRTVLATKDERANMDVDVSDYTLESIIGDFELQEEDNISLFVSDIQARLRNGEKLNIPAIKNIAKEYGFDNIVEIQEYVELAIINLAKEISNDNTKTEREKFDEIVELYETQPTISIRSSQRIELQQYSTPLPISFLAGSWVNMGNPNITLEATAGNGMMLINATGNVIANEIDSTRLENLKRQGYQVYSIDATKELPFSNVDALLLNPPFGSFETRFFGSYDSGKPAHQNIGEYPISGLAPIITLNSLNSLNNNGMAAIIIGGHTKYADNGSVSSEKGFLHYLYNFYNVEDVININGGLYSKQGTSFPIRMILISGRRTSETKRYAPVKKDANAEVVNTFNELYNRVKQKQDELLQRPRQVPNSIGTSNITKADSNVKGSDEKGIVKDAGKGGQKGVVSPGTKPAITNAPIGDTGGFSGGDNEQQRDVSDVGRDRGQETQEVVIGKLRGERGVSGVSGQNSIRIIENEKLPYPPASKMPQIGSVIPSNMITGISNTLSQLGDVDEYVASKLNVTKEKLKEFLAAEQIDGVAIAINKIENNGAAIIGDMTGVGKGRQAAAILRYAILAGFKPIFMTEKANLFNAIYRDMEALDSGKFKPFILNSGAKIEKEKPSGELEVVYDSPSPVSLKSVLDRRAVPKEYDYVLMTYSQVNRKTSPKKEFLAEISKNNILVLDESHNAGGESNTGLFMQEILSQSKGITFLSATFAKKPDNMPVYATKTSMGKVNMTVPQLIESVLKGGVPLQEILAKNLTEIGEYVRRERDFTGVKINWEDLTTEEASKELEKKFDDVMVITNRIIQFQKKYVNPIVQGISDSLAGAGATAGLTKGTEEMGATNTPFASKLFNLNQQLLLSIKAEEVAKKAVQRLKDGYKVVIALNNTNESFLNDFDFEQDEKVKVDFSATLYKGLMGVMKYSEKKFGVSEKKELSVNDLTEDGQKEFREIRKEINDFSSGLSISPIDVIRKIIKDAGYTIGELTGRITQLELVSPTEGIVTKRKKIDKFKIQTEFNNGTLDALVVNRSSSTGIDLHAGEKFKDKKQRVMIFAQPQLDINTEIQLRGRIDRTGQVHRGIYDYLISPIPAEMRLIMMLKKKLKSLDANTSGSEKSETNKIEIEDFLNKYGDDIVFQYLKENREINNKLLDPAKINALSESEIDEMSAPQDLALATTGKVPLLSVKEQREFYNDISERYSIFIESLGDENDLETKVFNLNAKTLESEVYIQGTDNNNPFSEDTILERVEIDMLRKPMKAEEIQSEISKKEDKSIFQDKFEEFIEEKLKTEIKNITSRRDEDIKDISDTAEKLKENKNQEDIEEIEKELSESIERKEFAADTRIEGAKARKVQVQRNVQDIFKKLNPGSSYLIPISVKAPAMSGSSPAIFIGFSARGKNMNPSNITARFATLDARRVVDIPLSKKDFFEAVQRSLYNDVKLDNWDSQIPDKKRTEAYIITGNILQAAAGQGNIIRFTTQDGQVRDGILLPQSFKAESRRKKISISSALNILNTEEELISGEFKLGFEYNKGERKIKISTPKSKALGEVYFGNKKLQSFIDGGNFVQSGNRMVGFVSISKAQGLLNFLADEYKMMVEVEPDKPTQLMTGKVPNRISRKAFDKLVEKLQKAFPKAKITFNASDVKGKAATEVKTQGGIIYGATLPDGTIYLNREAMSAEAPIHEFTHLWERLMPEEWKKGLEFFRKSSGFAKALKEIQDNQVYKDLTQEEKESEAMNNILGRMGEGYFSSDMLTKFKNWFTQLLKKVADRLNLRKLTPDEKFESFANKVLGDLFGGKDITEKQEVKKGKLQLSGRDLSIQNLQDVVSSLEMSLNKSITQDQIVEQMMPITDQMAEIEKEFSRRGYILEIDYDTVSVRDNNDFVEPKQLPKYLQNLVAQYESAFLKLESFDETALAIALQKSRATETRYADVVYIEDEGWAVETFPYAVKGRASAILGGVGLKTFPTKELAQIEADKQNKIIIEQISRRSKGDSPLFMASVPQEDSRFEELDEMLSTKSVSEKLNKKTEFIRKYGKEGEIMLDITRKFGEYIDKLEKNKYLTKKC